MPATLGSSLASFIALRLRAKARASDGLSFFLVFFSGLAFLPMRPWSDGVVERGRKDRGLVNGVRRMVRHAGAAIGRRAWVGKTPRRLCMLKMEDILTDPDCEVLEGERD